MALLKHVVVIGGGFGGLAAARALAKADVLVTLVDRRNHHVFTPLLYQVAMAGLSPAEIAGPIRSVLSKQKNARILLATATRIDLAARRVELAEAPALTYDYLVLAAGSRTNYFGHDEWEAVAPGLKDIEDAIEIRRRVLLAFEAAERETDPAVQRRHRSASRRRSPRPLRPLRPRRLRRRGCTWRRRRATCASSGNRCAAISSSTATACCPTVRFRTNARRRNS